MKLRLKKCFTASELLRAIEPELVELIENVISETPQRFQPQIRSQNDGNTLRLATSVQITAPNPDERLYSALDVEDGDFGDRIPLGFQDGFDNKEFKPVEGYIKITIDEESDYFFPSDDPLKNHITGKYNIISQAVIEYLRQDYFYFGNYFLGILNYILQEGPLPQLIVFASVFDYKFDPVTQENEREQLSALTEILAINNKIDPFDRAEFIYQKNIKVPSEIVDYAISSYEKYLKLSSELENYEKSFITFDFHESPQTSPQTNTQNSLAIIPNRERPNFEVIQFFFDSQGDLYPSGYPVSRFSPYYAFKNLLEMSVGRPALAELGYTLLTQ